MNQKLIFILYFQKIIELNKSNIYLAVMHDL